jgi:hypothetical protein
VVFAIHTRVTMNRLIAPALATVCGIATGKTDSQVTNKIN